MGEKQVKNKKNIYKLQAWDKPRTFFYCKKWEEYLNKKKWKLAVFVPTLLKAQGKSSKIIF